jgi:hypothetical protein
MTNVKLAQFRKDNGKGVSYKHSSTCCGAELKQKIMKKERIIDKEEFEKLRGNEQKSGNYFSIPHISFRYYCTNCDKPNSGEWEVKYHENLRQM